MSDRYYMYENTGFRPEEMCPACNRKGGVTITMWPDFKIPGGDLSNCYIKCRCGYQGQIRPFLLFHPLNINPDWEEDTEKAPSG